MMASKSPGRPVKNFPFQDVKVSSLTLELNQALESYQDDWEPHLVPSPSSVEQCMRRSWFIGTGHARTERVPGSSILAMEQGKAEESIVETILERAGFKVLQSQVEIDHTKIGCRGGTADMMLYRESSGNPYVGEIKRLRMFGFLDVVKLGVKKAHPEYYTQMQLYMKALDVPNSILIVLSADYSALKYYWNRIRNYPEDMIPPPVWTEEIAASIIHQEAAVYRAQKIEDLISTVEDAALVPREFDPWEEKFPCTYCGYQSACMEAG